MVRVRSPGKYVARPAWYDRNAVPRVDHFFMAGVAPHTATDRLTYTCPTGKKAMVEVLTMLLIRDGAPTTVGLTTCYFNYTPSGGALRTIYYIAMISATVGDSEAVQLGTAITLCAGDQIIMGTYDGSTAGTMRYHLSYKVTEFDA